MDQFFTIAKGRWVQWFLDAPSSAGLALLKVAQAEGSLVDHDDLAALLAGGNTEANFTNYARKTAIPITITVDDVNNRVDGDLADQTFALAGGATNNDLVKAVIYCQFSASDAQRRPVTHHDFVATTDGNDLSALISAAGFGRSQ